MFWRETLALPGYDNGFQRVESMARAGRDVVAVVNASLLCRFEADGERALARMRCDPAAGPVDHIVDDLLDAQPGAPVVVFRQGAGYYDQATGKKLLASDATGPVWGVSYPNGALAVIESGTRLRLLSPDGREEATELGTDSVELVGEWLVRVHQRPGGVALVARRVDGVPAAPVELLTAAIGHLGGSCVSGETLYVSYTVWSAGYDNPRNGLLIHRGTWFPPVPLGNSESMWNCSPEGAIVAVPAIRTDEPRPAGNGPYRSGFRRCTETGCDEPQRSGVYWLRGDPPLRFQGARHIPLRELHALLYYCKPSCGLRVRLAPLGRIDRTPDHVVMNTDAAFEGFEPYVISGLHSRDGQAAIMLVQTAERILALRIDASGELSALRPSP